MITINFNVLLILHMHVLTPNNLSKIHFLLPNLRVSFPKPAKIKTDGIKMENGKRSLISQYELLFNW